MPDNSPALRSSDNEIDLVAGLHPTNSDVPLDHPIPPESNLQIVASELDVSDHGDDRIRPHLPHEFVQVPTHPHIDAVVRPVHSALDTEFVRPHVASGHGRRPTRDELIMHHQKLVHYVAARFLGSGETLEDLVQVGNIGLINALDRYDPSKDVKFSTYAMPTIVGEIKRHFRDKTWQVKVPRWLQELSINARKSQQSLTIKLGRSPTIREIALEVGATEDRTMEALEITHIASTVSLDTRLDIGAGGDSATLMDVIGRSDRGLNDIDSYSDLRRAIDLLEARERQVVELRFFEDMSQAKIARQLNISQMHVSRLQQRALAHLRAILADEVARPRRGRRKKAV